MTRKQAIAALEGYGAANDRAGWMRVYVENRISFAAANAAWDAGQRLRRFIEKRESAQ